MIIKRDAIIIVSGAELVVDVRLTYYLASRMIHASIRITANIVEKVKTTVASLFSQPVFAPVVA